MAIKNKNMKRKPPHSTTVEQVTGLSATATLNGIYLQWNPVANAQGYWIYRNGYVPAIVQQTNYTDTVPHGTYTYQVAAVVNTVLGPKSASVIITN